MRCYCCNKILKPSEATRKFKESGSYTEMCDGCLAEITDVETVEGAGRDDEYFEDDGQELDE